MRLRQLHIRNFRKIDDLVVEFPPGLTVLVGENNAGKTAIIDALRFLLFPGRDHDALRLREDDYRIGTEFAPIELSCDFCDLTDEDEVHLQECLVDVGHGKFDARISVRAEFNVTSRRTNVRIWGGETEGGSLPSNTYDQITAVYLKPLRDPMNGLRPSSYSQVARLVTCLTGEASKTEFEEIAQTANDKVRGLDSVSNAKLELNGQLTSIAGAEMTQEMDLVFASPMFHRIVSGLIPEIDGLPFELNGLGYNNLVYAATTLGTLDRTEKLSFRSILIEEPEAHLHPQLQVLLLRHFANVAKQDENCKVQVVASSHSPILASQAPIDSVVVVHETDNNVRAVSISSLDIDPKLKRKLERYLDATRAELFFARRVLMVEGIAEALIVPVLAQMAGGCLKGSGVTVVNADGINFNAFIPLWGPTGLTVPAVILTDADPKEDKPVSDTTLKLQALTANIPHLEVEYSTKTFEHELARNERLLPLLLEALKVLHSTIGADLEKALDKVHSRDAKADKFFAEFKRAKVRKGKFAQEFAAQLESRTERVRRMRDIAERASGTRLEKLNVAIAAQELKTDDVPGYVLNAFRVLGVIKQKETDDAA